jgi:AcrR family transcriptional regulator
MVMPKFQRARSDEQREARRQAILRAATDMLAQMPVAELSLNELSRRVGLAKSNVLRYFDSREAVLLELLDAAARDWLARLLAILPPSAKDTTYADGAGHPDREQTERVAAALAESLVDDPMLCELISVSAAVLERNVSVDVARRYKVATTQNTTTLAGLVRDRVAGLSAEGAAVFAGATLVAIAGVWPLTQPSEAMLCVYQDPDLAALRMDFGTAVREVLATLLAGCLVRWPDAVN